jgi:uncharacterized membrane protein
VKYPRVTLFVLALIGLFISTYLLYVYVLGGPILCNGGHGCETVRASAQAKCFGISTPAYGVLFYVVTAGLIWLTTFVAKPWLRYGLLVWTAGGFAVSAYLTAIEAWVIAAWCVWCVASAILATLIFLLVWAKHRSLLPEIPADDTVNTV